MFGFGKKDDALSLLKKYESGKLDDAKFIEQFKKVNVFYSTPFGDHKDGTSKIFALPAQDGSAYLPVFSTKERAVEFYNQAGRVNFVLMEGTFASFMSTTSKINADKPPVQLGVIIEPMYNKITIDAKYL